MTRYRIKVDYERCIGAGACVAAAPEVFDQNEDDGMVVVLQESPPEELRLKVLEAARVCPARILEVVEED